MSSAFKPGDRIGRYRIVGLLGHGGMASVFRGMDEDLERAVAIKVLHPHLEGRQEAKDRFRREAKAIAKISHPNIVEIYEYSGEEACTSFIVTHLVSGGNLSDLKENTGEFPTEIAASIAVQVARGLLVAHSRGVIHRDIKPENLLQDADGTVKIADFGIAHLADAHDMTATGQILGSPYYMSPEQVLGDHLDERSDIFSFGSLLFWLYTGKLAFDGANPHAVLRNIVEKEAEDVERLSPAAGRKIGNIIQQCLRKSPGERFPSFDPIIKELEECLELSEVEDPRFELKQFVSSPEKYRQERKLKSIGIWSIKARQLEEKRTVREAMDLYNRVLALDPENEEVLSRLKRARSVQSKRRAIKWAASAAALFSLLVAGFFLGIAFFPEKPGGEPGPGSTSGTVAPPWKSIATYGSEAKGDGAGPGAAGGARKDLASGTKPKINPGAQNPAQRKTTRFQQEAESRKVRFVPYPKTVNIHIDGAEVGSYFSHQEMDLAVGQHTLRFEPQDKECCEAAEWKVNVLPGHGAEAPQIIGKRLAFHTASLIVFSDKPADVIMEGRKIGRTGEFIDVSMSDVKKTLEVTVRAEGCDIWTSSVTLRAGRKSDIRVNLDCS